MLRQAAHSVSFQYVNSHGNETFTVHNPHDESLVVSGVQVANEQDVDDAVKAARAAFEGPWRGFSGKERAKCMLKLADLIEENEQKLINLEAECMGAPIAVGKGTLGLAITTWRCKYIETRV